MRGRYATWFVALTFLVACGGSGKPAETPEPSGEKVDEVEQPEAKADKPKGDEGKGDEGKGDEGKGDEGKGKKPGAEPEFKDDMSVDDAMNAAKDTERVNVDHETLGKPLMEESLYKPCKLSPAAHFKLRVAVWEGRAVGIDVTATPKNPKLEQCVRDQIKTVKWKDSVKSLNTVEYAF